MITLDCRFTGGEIAGQLAHDGEELGYFFAAMVEYTPSDTAEQIAEHRDAKEIAEFLIALGNKIKEEL